MSRHPLVVKLKSGEYDGADIMKAWLLIEQLEAQLDATEKHEEILAQHNKTMMATIERVRRIQKKPDKPFIDDRECSWIDGWNDCLDEVAQALEVSDE